MIFRTLDYIFVSSECQVESFGVYPPPLDDTNKFDTDLAIPPSNGPYPTPEWPSDHSLLAATISYP